MTQKICPICERESCGGGITRELVREDGRGVVPSSLGNHMTDKRKDRSMPLFCCEEAADAAIIPLRNLSSGIRVAYDPCAEDGKCDFCCKQIITWKED